MQRGLRKVRRRDGCLSNRNLNPARAGGGSASIRSSPPRIRISKPRSAPAFSTAIRTSFSISVGRTISLEIACDAFTTVSTSNCPTGGPIAARSGGSSFLAQARIAFVELLYLSVGAPTVVAVPRVAEIGVARGFDTARQVVLRRQFVGQALVLNEAVLARQMDSLLVQTQCIGVSLFDAGDLGQNQRVLVGESRWINFRPTRGVVPGAPSGVCAMPAADRPTRSRRAPPPLTQCSRSSRAAAICPTRRRKQRLRLSPAASASA